MALFIFNSIQMYLFYLKLSFWIAFVFFFIFTVFWESLLLGNFKWIQGGKKSLQVLLESDIILLVGKYSVLVNFSGRKTFQKIVALIV